MVPVLCPGTDEKNFKNKNVENIHEVGKGFMSFQRVIPRAMKGINIPT